MQLNKLFRTPKNQVSTPRPECGVGFDSSARAMNRSASKGSLMVHEYSHTTPAVKGILSFATFSERKHMLKTLKRKIALVAVAAVGVGMLSAIPASAAITAATTGVIAPSTNGSSRYALIAKDGANSATEIAVYLGQTVALNTRFVASADAGADTETVSVDSGAAAAQTITETGANTALNGGATLATYTNPTAAAAADDTTNLIGFVASADTDTVNFQTGVDVTVTQLTAITSSVTATNSGPVRAASGQTANIMWSATAGQIKPTATNAPMVLTTLASPAASTVTYVPATGALDLATSGGVSVGSVRVDVAGSYTLLSFWDMNANGTAESSEPQVIYTFATSAAATNIAVQAAQSAAAAQAKEFSVALLTAASTATQAVANEFVSISAVAATGTVTLTNGAGTSTTGNATTLVANTTGGAATASTAFIAFTDFADGFVNFKVAGNTANDTITITVTPSATLVAAGASAKTTTLKVVPANASTTMAATVTTSTLLIADSANTTTSLNAYKTSLDVSTFVFNVTGLTPSTSYTADITLSANAGTRTATVDGAAYAIVNGVDTGGANTGVDLVRASSATGTDTFTLVLSGGLANTETITLDLDAAGAGTQVNARVIAGSLAYTNTLSAPATNPTIAISGSAVALAGTIADQFGNPTGGVSVVVTGTVTPAGTALTGTAVSGNDGKWSVSVTPAASTTSVSFGVTAVRTGITVAALTARVVNLTTGGNPTAGAATTTPATTTTTIPAVLVPYDGQATGVTDESYTLATATVAGALDAGGIDGATEECIALTPSTTPAATIVVTGSAGVKFYATVCGNDADHSVAAAVDTLTVASGTQIWATSTKNGENTITMTAGSVVTTQKFWAHNSIAATNLGAAARNVAITGPASLDTNGISTVTVKITDAFGNPVRIAATVTVAVTITGNGLLSGNSSSATVAATDANGEAKVALIGLSTAGDTVVTVTGTDITNAKFGAAAGSLTVTAGTSGLTASVATASLTIPVKASATASATDTAVNAVKTDVATANAAVKALATQVTVLQASVATLIDSLTTQIASLMKSVSALTKAVAKLQAKK